MANILGALASQDPDKDLRESTSSLVEAVSGIGRQERIRKFGSDILSRIQAGENIGMATLMDASQKYRLSPQETATAFELLKQSQALDTAAAARKLGKTPYSSIITRTGEVSPEATLEQIALLGGVPKREKPTQHVLSPGQKLFGETGQEVASVPPETKEREKKHTVVPAGSSIYDENGKLIGTAPEKQTKEKKFEIEAKIEALEKIGITGSRAVMIALGLVDTPKSNEDLWQKARELSLKQQQSSMKPDEFDLEAATEKMYKKFIELRDVGKEGPAPKPKAGRTGGQQFSRLAALYKTAWERGEDPTQNSIIAAATQKFVAENPGAQKNLDDFLATNRPAPKRTQPDQRAIKAGVEQVRQGLLSEQEPQRPVGATLTGGEEVQFIPGGSRMPTARKSNLLQNYLVWERLTEEQKKMANDALAKGYSLTEENGKIYASIQGKLIPIGP